MKLTKLTMWLVLVLVVVAAGCGPLIEQAPFAVRPDSIRPADLLGPYDGLVLDADSDRPVAGATVSASWAFENGVGFHAPSGARELVVQTGADGRYTIPRLDDLPEGASSRIRRFTLVVYHRGHVGWRSDRVFPGLVVRRDFSQRGNRVRLDRWLPAYRHATQLVFLGGGSKVRLAAAWELQPAALELEGERLPVTAHGNGEATASPSALVPLDVSKLLSDDEIRAVTGYVGKFEDGKLTDLPTTEFYDSRHFKALGKPESFDVGLRVWRLGSAASEVQYNKLMTTLPGARGTDEIGDASFRAQSGEIGGLVFLVRERGVVVSMTCGNGQCPEPAQLAKLAKLVESRLPELPAEQPRLAPPSAPGTTPEGTTPGDVDNPAVKPSPSPEVPTP
ncbi:MAG TPA: carboxypeptidase-like regulatory domain-containing protein [Polyangia bacterium]|jgi:hypothetical protein|nr:carboxypeptidase-like regulatory domain-containing protein [Polyangia bacterium]